MERAPGARADGVCGRAGRVCDPGRRGFGPRGVLALDARSFATELGRVTAAARWRGHDASLAVFDVDGVAHGPGVDESEMIAHVGALARSAVRSNDIVGHLGAGRFALLLPRAGSFEARSAYRRVRDGGRRERVRGDRRGLRARGLRGAQRRSGDDHADRGRSAADRRAAPHRLRGPLGSVATRWPADRGATASGGGGPPEIGAFLQLDITSIIVRGRRKVRKPRWRADPAVCAPARSTASAAASARARVRPGSRSRA